MPYLVTPDATGHNEEEVSHEELATKMENNPEKNLYHVATDAAGNGEQITPEQVREDADPAKPEAEKTVKKDSKVHQTKQRRGG